MREKKEELKSGRGLGRPREFPLVQYTTIQ